MRDPMFCNRFTILMKGNGECNINFLSVVPMQDLNGKILMPKGTSSEFVEWDGKYPHTEFPIDEQRIFMSSESLESLAKEIQKVIESSKQGNSDSAK